MTPLRVLLTSLLVLAGVGCAHVRPQPTVEACRLRALPLNVGANHPARVQGQKTFDEELRDVLGRRRDAAGRFTADPARAAPDEFMVLSGGSQNGAFGAGLGYGLGRQPTYRIVTGVSTGALLSTLYFLANETPPADRTPYPESRPDLPYRGGRSSAEDAVVAYLIAREGELLKTGSSQLYDGLVKGSVGELTPARQRLLRFLTPSTLAQLKAAHEADRRLYVGVTNVDDGRAYAIDLTELAARMTGPQDPEVPRLRECYVDALLASSSVPIAAQPVTLNIAPVDKVGRPGPEQTDLFVDGGVRYGVFLRQLPLPPSAQVNVSLIVNGRLYSRDWGEGGERPEKWSPITLGLRSIDLLKNQVYRFSVEDVERFPRGANGELRMAFISSEGLQRLPGDPDEHLYRGRTCRQWKVDDERTSKPVEFHPNFMACLIDYGAARGRTDPWNLVCRGDADCQAKVARLP